MLKLRQMTPLGGAKRDFIVDDALRQRGSELGQGPFPLGPTKA
ncbi:MAG TPA: hypothetical protein VGN05_01895 [Parvibaculum sp.]